ncbi:hypothetical protein V1291_003590 [Nitrobacteraceae bacterium AZCC 1564]
MSTMKRTDKDEVDRIVAAIDKTRAAEHFRNPDRPDSKFVRRRRRQDPAIGRAKARLRTALYRNRLDQRCAPSTAEIGMALVVALATAKLDELTEADRGLVGRALVDLRERGFSVDEAKEMLRGLRRRLVESTDGKAESADDIAHPLE